MCNKTASEVVLSAGMEDTIKNLELCVYVLYTRTPSFVPCGFPPLRLYSPHHAYVHSLHLVSLRLVRLAVVVILVLLAADMLFVRALRADR